MGKTLLLADDSVTIQKVVGISFASEDISITTVDNGDDAITRARELRPDVVLADVVMPGKSGYDVCEAIKADPQLAHIPVLLLTGTFEAFDEEHASRVGAAGHVAKPFEAQTLVERVKGLLAATPAAPPVPEPTPAPAPTPAVAAAPEMPAPIPASASENPDNSFDFFDDNIDDLASSSPMAPAAPPAAPADDNLDFGGPDAAFAFGEEDLAAATQEPMPAPPLPVSAGEDAQDATVAILPGGSDGGGPSLDPDLLNAPTEIPRAGPAPEPAAAALPEPGLPPTPQPTPPAPAVAPTPIAAPEPVPAAPLIDPAPVAPLVDPEPMPPAPAVASTPIATPEPAPPAVPAPVEPAPPMLDTAESPAAGVASGQPTPAPAEDDLDFEFETVRPGGAAGAAVSSADLAQASVLDPSAGTDFDVSSSDLGTPMVAPPPAAATQVIGAPVSPPVPEGPPSLSGLSGGADLSDDPVMDLLTPETTGSIDSNEATLDPAPADAAAPVPPMPAQPAAPPPSPALDASPNEVGAWGTPETPETDTQPELQGGEPVAVQAAETPPAADPPAARAVLEPPAPAAAQALEPEPAPEAEPAAFEPQIDAPDAPDWDAVPPLEAAMPASPEAPDAAIPGSPDLDAIVERVAPALREQLHETLERIAWESFGQVTEKLVEQSLERIEKIAWEVVPKLAESLIQEEIRKLKSGRE